MPCPMSEGRTARLIEDGGAAAADPGHFFRSPEFLAAEGVTHTLAIEGGPEDAAAARDRAPDPGQRSQRRHLPLRLPGRERRARRAAPDPPAVDWSQTGLVSLFVRDRVGEAPALAGGTVRAEVHIADPKQESGMRKRLREQIRRNERRGWTVAAEPGREAEPADRAAFERAYAETMARTGAAARYLYRLGVLRAAARRRAGLAAAGRARGRGGRVRGQSRSPATTYLHYFLGGTRGRWRSRTRR